MSVRIYQLSKEIGMENAELLDILRERGFQVKSDRARSTTYFRRMHQRRVLQATRASRRRQRNRVEEVAEAAPVTPPPSLGLPCVRTKGEIEQEKEEAAKEAPAAKSAPPPSSKPSPAAPPPPASAPASAPPSSPR